MHQKQPPPKVAFSVFTLAFASSGLLALRGGLAFFGTATLALGGILVLGDDVAERPTATMNASVAARGRAAMARLRADAAAPGNGRHPAPPRVRNNPSNLYAAVRATSSMDSLWESATLPPPAAFQGARKSWRQRKRLAASLVGSPNRRSGVARLGD